MLNICTVALFFAWANSLGFIKKRFPGILLLIAFLQYSALFDTAGWFYTDINLIMCVYLDNDI